MAGIRMRLLRVKHLILLRFMGALMGWQWCICRGKSKALFHNEIDCVLANTVNPIDIARIIVHCRVWHSICTYIQVRTATMPIGRMNMRTKTKKCWYVDLFRDNDPYDNSMPVGRKKAAIQIAETEAQKDGIYDIIDNGIWVLFKTTKREIYAREEYV